MDFDANCPDYLFNVTFQFLFSIIIFLLGVIFPIEISGII